MSKSFGITYNMLIHAYTFIHEFSRIYFRKKPTINIFIY